MEIPKWLVLPAKLRERLDAHAAKVDGPGHELTERDVSELLSIAKDYATYLEWCDKHAREIVNGQQ